MLRPQGSARSSRWPGWIMTLNRESKHVSHWSHSTFCHLGRFYIAKMSSGTFVDRIDPFAKRSLKKKTKKSQGSSRYRNTQDVELQALPLLKGDYILHLPRSHLQNTYWRHCSLTRLLLLQLYLHNTDNNYKTCQSFHSMPNIQWGYAVILIS